MSHELYVSCGKRGYLQFVPFDFGVNGELNLRHTVVTLAPRKKDVTFHRCPKEGSELVAL